MLFLSKKTTIFGDFLENVGKRAKRAENKSRACDAREARKPVPKPLKEPSLARSVPKPLKVPSLARSVPKPLKVPSLARSVPKPLKVPSLARSVPKPLLIVMTSLVGTSLFQLYSLPTSYPPACRPAGLVVMK